MDVLGLIPARLGSTEVKRKNIRHMAGQPLIEYAIQAALGSLLDRVILSTEAEEIAEVGRRAGVEVPFLRPPELASTEAKAIGVVSHALETLERDEGWKPDGVMYLQPTSPFRASRHIDEALEIFRDGDKNSVVSVGVAESHPAYMFAVDEYGSLTDLLDPQTYRAERRQDMIPVYAINDAVLLSRRSYLSEAAKAEDLIVDLSDFQPYIVEPPVTVDINTEQDFLWADFLMRQQKGMLA